MTDRQDNDRQFKGKITNGVKPVLAAAARHGSKESGARTSTEKHRRVQTQVDEANFHFAACSVLKSVTSNSAWFEI